jgi:hypothetical protein
MLEALFTKQAVAREISGGFFVGGVSDASLLVVRS